jgi:hypothetical protein
VPIRVTSADLADARSRVLAGAAFLDEEHPGWHTRIDADRLDMRNFENDVIGQLYGSYPMGLDELGLSDEQAWMFGFDVLPSDPSWSRAYRELDDEWRRVISERQRKQVTR